MANLPDFGQFTQNDIESNPKNIEQRKNEYGLLGGKHKKKQDSLGSDMTRPLMAKSKLSKPNLFIQSHQVKDAKEDEEKRKYEQIK